MEDFDKLALTWDDEPRRIERAKTIAKEIINSIPDLRQMLGLEYGCGTGLLSLNLQTHLKHMTLADNSDGMLEVLRQKLEKTDIRNMKLLKFDLATDEVPAINSDIIYTLMTMHHIVDIDKIIRAFYQILRPQGYLCIADLDEEDGSFHGKDFIGHNGFNREQLTRRIESHGFHDVHNKICYETVKKSNNGQEKRYPIFLMIAQREGSHDRRR